MTYPRPDQYNLAIQSPHSFADPHLVNAKAKRNTFGLPVCASGGFALTYRLSGPSGDWAVRCFKHPNPDREERYQHISNFIKTHRSSYLVAVEYQTKGILVNGEWYPITKLEWIGGESLGYFVEKNLRSPESLKELNEKFIKMIEDLEDLGIAHGDLQHGNIRVVNGQLKLIDYDGMFVPSLKGWRSCELGHRNYQHPRRSEQHFDQTLDRFSAIVIYLGLVALSRDPLLWDKFSDGGDNLLFRAEDFANPDNSALVRELHGIIAPSSMIEIFRVICRGRVEDVPKLNDVLLRKYHVVPTQAETTAVVRPRYEVISAEDRSALLQREGEIVEVVGQIRAIHAGTTRFGRPYVFLNFGNYQEGCFTIVIWSKALRLCKDRGLDLEKLEGKWVSCTGLLTIYERRSTGALTREPSAKIPTPQMELDQPSQLKVLASRVDAEERIRGQRDGPARRAAVLNRLYRDFPIGGSEGPRGPVDAGLPDSASAGVVPALMVSGSSSVRPHGAVVQAGSSPSGGAQGLPSGTASSGNLCPRCGNANPEGSGVCRSCRFHVPLDSQGRPTPTSFAPGNLSGPRASAPPPRAPNAALPPKRSAVDKFLDGIDRTVDGLVRWMSRWFD